MENKKDLQPVRWSLRFLQWFCPDYLVEEIEGDLLQRFERDLITHSKNKASRRLLWNVIRFCRPGIIIRNKGISKNLLRPSPNGEGKG